MTGAETEDPIAFYARYIDAFNRRDEPAFVACFHRPIVAMRPPGDGGDPTVLVPTTITEPADLWPPLPAIWTHSTIDDLRVVADGAALVPRPGFTGPATTGSAIEATVTRWAGDAPYEQYQVLYLLTREDGRLGIKAMLPLANATR